MRTPEYTGPDADAGPSRSAARITCSAATDVDVRAGKTGFISKSGYCLATLLRLPAERPAGRGRRARRALERRPLHRRRRTCSTGCRARRRRSSRPRPPARQQQRLAQQPLRPLAHIPALHRRRVERQRRDRIDRHHHRPRRVPAVVRLQIAPADVARVHAIAAVARRERRDERPVVVRAERTGERRERPLRRRSGRRSAGGRRSA